MASGSSVYHPNSGAPLAHVTIVRSLSARLYLLIRVFAELPQGRALEPRNLVTNLCVSGRFNWVRVPSGYFFDVRVTSVSIEHPPVRAYQWPG